MKPGTSPVILLACIFILAACQPAPQSPPAASPAPETQAPVALVIPTPTLAPPPTAIPLPSPTALPEGVIFRDDFDGPLQPGWTWENENSSMWAFTGDGWLRIKGESDSLLGEKRQKNMLWYSLPAGEFVITVHLKARPSENFHQAAIFIYEDAEHYVTINRGFCDICETGGNGFYMDYKIGDDWGNYHVRTEAEDVYLRLESRAKVISGYYATEPDVWERLGRVGNYFAFTRVGLGVSNLHAGSMVVGLFDFFEISIP